MVGHLLALDSCPKKPWNNPTEPRGSTAIQSVALWKTGCRHVLLAFQALDAHKPDEVAGTTRDSLPFQFFMGATWSPSHKAFHKAGSQSWA